MSVSCDSNVSTSASSSCGSISLELHAYDEYLLQKGYFRKHVTADASSLFRVISDHIFETEAYYPKIRTSCIDFMAKNRTSFEGMIAGNFMDYLRKLKFPTQMGSATELLALALCYERNVMVFEPLGLGKWLHNDPKHTDCFMVFLTPSGHYDIVYRLFAERVIFDDLTQKMAELCVNDAVSVSQQRSGTSDQETQGREPNGISSGNMRNESVSNDVEVRSEVFYNENVILEQNNATHNKDSIERRRKVLKGDRSAIFKKAIKEIILDSNKKPMTQTKIHRTNHGKLSQDYRIGYSNKWPDDGIVIDEGGLPQYGGQDENLPAHNSLTFDGNTSNHSRVVNDFSSQNDYD